MTASQRSGCRATTGQASATATFDVNWTGQKLSLLTDFIGIDTRTAEGGRGNYDGTTGADPRIDERMGEARQIRVDPELLVRDVADQHLPFAGEGEGEDAALAGELGPGAAAGRLDGLAHLADGTFLVTSWDQKCIYRGPAAGPFTAARVGSGLRAMRRNPS